MNDDQSIWRISKGDGPVLAVALHDGHDIREGLEELMAVDEATRLREEDPFTREWTAIAPTRIVALRSRFEVDLNRPRDKAVYMTEEDAWGLQVWKEAVPEQVVKQSLAEYDSFYRCCYELFLEMKQRHGRFVVLDLHSYNHRRGGPDMEQDDPAMNPQINLGTATMNRERWSGLVDRFVSDLRSFEFPDGNLDVRENVRFGGGWFARWVHETFPEEGCVLAIEVKKVFIDEWTGEPCPELIDAMGEALGSVIPGIMDELDAL